MKSSSLLSKISMIFLAIVACVFISFLIFVGVRDNVDAFASRDDSGYREVVDYTCSEIVDESAPAGVVKKYGFVIGDQVEHNEYLAFYITHQYSEVYIDGVLVSRISATDGGVIKTTGSNWVMVPINAEDAGKEVVVLITPVYKSFVDREVEFLLGSDLAIYKTRLVKDLPEMVLSLLAIFIGATFIIIGIWNVCKNKSGEDIAMLGLFSIMVGLWRFTDTRFTPFIFPSNSVLVFYLSISMLMLGIIPLIKSLSYRYGAYSKIIFDVCSIGLAAISLVQLILQMSGVMDIRQNLFVTHVAIIIVAIIILVSLIHRMVKERGAKRLRFIDFLPFVCVAGAIADLIAFYANGNSSGLVFTLASFIIYILVSGLFMLKDYSERGKKLAEQEKELLKSQIAIMMSQIKPHFVYNSLTSIGELCMTDPARARDALMDFSDYLRNNMDGINTEECVHFSKELKHIETYLNLEKMRFGSRLNVEYDIEEDNFFVPPLTIQPLVENAVKHGVCAKKEGGTIKLATKREGDTIVVTITDDGVGFDAQSQPSSDGKTHIGIANVKRRLEQMANAELSIVSQIGQGTVAKIVIYPKD
ncbi:MAG: sensor histidine kinase [Christensenellales bacterium]